MNLRKPLVLLAALLTLTACIGPFESGNQGSVIPKEEPEGTRHIDFSGYRGSRATLPEDMFVSGVNSAGEPVGLDFTPFSGVHTYTGQTSNPADSFDGFGAFTSGTGDYSFGIREHGTTDLQDSRLYFAYRNETFHAIIGFRVQFSVEVWYLGQRDNRIRLKYNDSPSGYSRLATIVSVANPLYGYVSPDGVALNGSSSEHRTTVTAEFYLENLLDVEGTRAGIRTLRPGEIGYFRWQYSNGTIFEGDLRSGLAINDITVTPIYAHNTASRGMDETPVEELVTGFHS